MKSLRYITGQQATQCRSYLIIQHRECEPYSRFKTCRTLLVLCRVLTQSANQIHGGYVERLEETDKVLGARTSSWMEIRGTPSHVEKNKAAVDCDFAGDIANRKSATGLIFNGRKTRGQHGFGLEVDSVAELRRERLPRHGESWRRHLRLRALLSDGRVVAQLVIASCSSAARSLSSRRGLGRERHVRTRVFWRQVRVKLRRVKAACSGGTETSC